MQTFFFWRRANLLFQHALCVQPTVLYVYSKKKIFIICLMFIHFMRRVWSFVFIVSAFANIWFVFIMGVKWLWNRSCVLSICYISIFDNSSGSIKMLPIRVFLWVHVIIKNFFYYRRKPRLTFIRDFVFEKTLYTPLFPSFYNLFLICICVYLF